MQAVAAGQRVDRRVLVLGGQRAGLLRHGQRPVLLKQRAPCPRQPVRPGRELRVFGHLVAEFGEGGLHFLPPALVGGEDGPLQQRVPGGLQEPQPRGRLQHLVEDLPGGAEIGA